MPSFLLPDLLYLKLSNSVSVFDSGNICIDKTRWNWVSCLCHFGSFGVPTPSLKSVEDTTGEDPFFCWLISSVFVHFTCSSQCVRFFFHIGYKRADKEFLHKIVVHIFVLFQRTCYNQLMQRICIVSSPVKVVWINLSNQNYGFCPGYAWQKSQSISYKMQ